MAFEALGACVVDVPGSSAETTDPSPGCCCATPAADDDACERRPGDGGQRWDSG